MVPQKLGRFEVVGELGRGAMGVVYKGLDPKIQRPVALKVLKYEHSNPTESDIQGRERFLVEARAAGQLSHPNILTIYDAGEEGALAYIAMEYLEGGTLQDMISENRFESYDQILDIVRQVAEGLAHAHSKNIVHRDIKPANIMMSDGKIPKIADFGLARLSDSTLTTTGTVLGTPSYMAPEQIRGRKVDGRADLFALGVIFYEMLTGEKPFGGESITSVIYRVVNEQPIPPRQLNLDLPPGINEFMNKALAKDPNERFQTGAEFAAAIRDLQAGRTLASASGTAGQTQILSSVETTHPSIQSMPSLESAAAGAKALLKNRNMPYIVGGAAAVMAIILIASLFGGGEDGEKKAMVSPPPVTERQEPADIPVTVAETGEAAQESDKVADAEGKPAAGDKGTTRAAEEEVAEVSQETADQKDTAGKPVIPTSLLSVSSKPAGADVYINEKLMGKTPYLNRRYKQKAFKMKLILGGYETHEKDFTLDKDMVFNVILQKKSEQAEVAEKTEKPEEPSAAEKASTEAVTTEEGKKEDASIWTQVFNPKAAGNVGTLIVHTQPGDKVTINGVRYEDSPVKLADTPIGTKNIFIVRKGFKPFMESATLKKGETLEITPQFKE